MTIEDISTGLQHVGIPTNDIEKTIAFYEMLGFVTVHRADNRGEAVAFLKMGDLILCDSGKEVVDLNMGGEVHGSVCGEASLITRVR